MSERKPFTLKERKRVTQSFGHRPVNDWGSGDLPAPWCPGDVVHLDQRDSYPAGFLARLNQGIRGRTVYHDRGKSEAGGRNIEWTHGFFVVTAAFSIDDGDAWYFRVWGGESDHGSDRMHVAYSSRASRYFRGHACNFMSPFSLVETTDPEGLERRAALLAAGWKPPRSR